MRRVVGNRLGSDVLTVGRVAVFTEVKAEMQKILSEYDTGVRLVTVELQDVTPPDTVKPAFNEVNEARQDRERSGTTGGGRGRRLLHRLLGRLRAATRRSRDRGLDRWTFTLGLLKSLSRRSFTNTLTEARAHHL